MGDQAALDSVLSMACPHCNGQILQRAVFCPHCGMRLESADGVPFASARHPVAAARFEPPMRSFEATDFEGDLDAPAGSPDFPADVPDGEPNRQSSASAFEVWRQWGRKGKVGLILASCVVLFGGLALLHRYDSPSTSSLSEDGSTKSTDGAIAANDPSGPRLDGAMPALTGQGAVASAPSVTARPTANAASPRAHTGRAGAAQRRHWARGRAREHAHAKRWHIPSRDTTYMHVDLQPERSLARRRTSVA
jgi:hypothetical protein